MSPDRKIETGIRASLAGGLLLFSGCGLPVRPPTSGESTSQVSPTPTEESLQSHDSKLIAPPANSMAESIVKQINSEYSIDVVAENWDLDEELKILMSMLDKIPGSGYLANGGIGIHKDQQFLREGGLQGIIPFYGSKKGDGFNLMLGNEFNPNSIKGIKQNRLYSANQKEQLEWGLAWIFGHLFSERVSKKSHFSGNEDERNLKLFQDPIYSTFAKVAGWQFGPTDVDAQTVMIEFKEGQATSKTEVKKFVGWHRQTADGQFYSNIEGAFAEFFATYIFHPTLLSEEQRKYFGNIHEGLKNNPEQFIGEIRRYPQILLR